MDNMIEPVVLFVYGTLKEDKFRFKQIEPHLLRNPIKATTFGSLYDLGNFPAIVFDAPISNYNRIYGEVVIGTRSLLTVCDAIEGYKPDDSGLYKRRHIDTHLTHEDRTETALVYYMNYKTLTDAGITGGYIENGEW